ncbi:lipopolysaccharide export system protein LptA [Brevirhabdus pacifica]|nr:lipopolysaccharide export system protein LptA [Brevirhabdus pacifica]
MRFSTVRMALAAAAAGMLWAALPQAAIAQAQVAFGGLKVDSSLPVEVTADSLSVSQSDGTAVFTGNVLVGQGEMRMTAGTIRVEYAQDGSNDIRKMVATGGVTFVNGQEAAEAREAIYTLESGQVVMTGDVILTQGPNAISGERLTVNLNDGTGQMDGRVKTILQTGNR